jgi:UDP-3-O-[3-hydroxymyristoyl] glucosamine N-acyltransferase
LLTFAQYFRDSQYLWIWINKKAKYFCVARVDSLTDSASLYRKMQFTANQIAALVGGKVEGDGNVAVSTFAKIEEGHPGAISFLANPKYFHFIYQTESSIVLVHTDFKLEHPVKPTLIRVADPYATMARLLDIAAAAIEPKYSGIEQPSYVSAGVEVPDDIYIGAFAYIGRGVKLGKGVKIFPQVYIGDNVVIGDNTVLKPGVKVYHNCHIGQRCVLHAGCVVGGDGFGFAPTANGYKKIPQLGNVVLEDDVELGANTTVDRAMMGSTVIGRGTKLDNLVQIGHTCRIGQDTVMAAQVGIAGSTKVGNQCMFGGQVGLAGHITVGDRVQLGAQSGVPGNVASDSKLMGSPAIEQHRYARGTVYQKQLGDLFDRVKNLENKSNQQ